MSRKICMALLLALILLPAATVLAGTQMAFKDELPIRTFLSGSCFWIQAGSIDIAVPSKGFVVLTASGMAAFNDFNASLTLTFARTPATKGPWVYTLSPGGQPFQAYTVRKVFTVNPGTQTFSLNAISCDGLRTRVEIQTGSLTAEFYPLGSATGTFVTRNAQGAAASTTASDPKVNNPSGR